MIKTINCNAFAPLTSAVGGLRETYFSMMKYILIAVVTLFSSILSQAQIVQKDTTRVMPRLEIPEITIVGKKAITLPFARKGEIYDVSNYEAPPADTSILMHRPAMSLPIGSLPRYDEPLIPWHVSVEGAFGSFSNLHLRSFVDYKGRKWGMYGNAGVNTTKGHTDHASGKSLGMQVISHTLVKTDNDFLKSFRVFGGMKFLSELYEMFGFKDISYDRSRTNFTLDGRLQSLDREMGAFDFSLIADIWSISDTYSGKDSSAVSASPALTLGYKTQFSTVQLASELQYSSSSLDYDHSVETPSLIGFSTSINWMLMEKWSMYVGGLLQSGSASDGLSRSLLLPFAKVKWEIDHDRELSFWFNPAMYLDSYGELSKQNPYLVREVVIRPERIPINLGSTFWYNGRIISIELNSAFSKSNDHRVTLADSGRIWFDYVDAVQFYLKANCTVNLIDKCHITFKGVVQPSCKEGKSTQLPMAPIVQVGGKGEYQFNFPLNVWSGVEFWSKQNADLAGTKTLDSRFMLGIGASSNIIPRTVLSFEINNLLNDQYEWWSGYKAPGITFNLNAKVNFR